MSGLAYCDLHVIMFYRVYSTSIKSQKKTVIKGDEQEILRDHNNKQAQIR